MVKKISRRSRLARRNEIQEIGDKSLISIPRASKTDIANILIRTEAKNEALMNGKIHKSKNKGRVRKKTSINNSFTFMGKKRLERALNSASKLDGKIEKSVTRAKYIQTARKSDWNTTNSIIKQEMSSKIEKEPSSKMAEKDDDLKEMILGVPNVFCNLMDDAET